MKDDDVQRDKASDIMLEFFRDIARAAARLRAGERADHDPGDEDRS